MKIYRYLDGNDVRYAVANGDTARRAGGTDLFHLNSGSGAPLDVLSLPLLPPVHPGKIVAVGRNYADHAKELGHEAPPEPIIFLKPPSSVIGPGGSIVRPAVSQRVDFEGELALVIGRKARNVSSTQWRDYVFGFTCANDVTARDLQRKDVQFTRGKGFDTFCPLGPCIQTDLDPSDVRLATRVNGQVRQSESTRQMLFSCGVIVEFISGVMTLDPGDVILTGTPAGVGPLQSGDTVEVEIAGIGVLRNPVL